MGRLVSDLLAHALKEDGAPATIAHPEWIAKPMGARVNLSDKESVYRRLHTHDRDYPNSTSFRFGTHWHNE